MIFFEYFRKAIPAFHGIVILGRLLHSIFICAGTFCLGEKRYSLDIFSSKAKRNSLSGREVEEGGFIILIRRRVMVISAYLVLFAETHRCGSFAHVRRHIVDAVTESRSIHTCGF